MLTLSASVTCMNPLTYGTTIPALDAAGLSAYHLDMCDGRFAPTFLLYPGLLPHLRSVTTRRLDVHLYCLRPSLYVDELARCGADTIVIHHEIEEDPAAVLQQIRSLGVAAGLAFLPTTTVADSVGALFPGLRMVVANSVGPAYAGQVFDPRGLDNMRRVRELAASAGCAVEIVADGSVRADRLPSFFAAGCDHLVLGTASVFSPNTDWIANFAAFRRVAEDVFATSHVPPAPPAREGRV